MEFKERALSFRGVNWKIYILKKEHKSTLDNNKTNRPNKQTKGGVKLEGGKGFG